MGRKFILQVLLLAALCHCLSAKARAKSSPHQGPFYAHQGPSTPATPVTIQNYNIQGPVKLAHDNAQVHVNDYNNAAHQRPAQYGAHVPYGDASYPPAPPQHREPPYIVVAYNADLRNGEQLPPSPAAAAHHANNNQAPIQRPYYVTAPYYNSQGYQAPVYNAPVVYQQHQAPSYSQYARPAYQEVPVYQQQVHRAPVQQAIYNGQGTAPLYQQPQRINQQAPPSVWVHHSPSQTVVYNATNSAVKQQADVDMTGNPHQTVPVAVSANRSPVQMKAQVKKQQVMKSVAPPTPSKIIVHQTMPQLSQAAPVQEEVSVVLVQPHPTPMPTMDEASAVSDVEVVQQVVAAEPTFVDQSVQQEETSPEIAADENAVITPEQETEATTTTEAPQIAEVSADESDAITTEGPIEEQPAVTEPTADLRVVTVAQAAANEDSAVPSSAQQKEEQTPVIKPAPVPLIYRNRMEDKKAPGTVRATSVLPLIYRSTLNAKVALQKAASSHAKSEADKMQDQEPMVQKEMVSSTLSPKEETTSTTEAPTTAATVNEKPVEEEKVQDEAVNKESTHQVKADEVEMTKPVEDQAMPVVLPVKKEVTENVNLRPYPFANKQIHSSKTAQTSTGTVVPHSSIRARPETLRQRMPAQVHKNKVYAPLPIEEPDSEEVLDSREQVDSREEEHDEDYYDERQYSQPRYPSYLGNRNNRPTRPQLKFNVRRPYPVGYGQQSAAHQSGVRQLNKPSRGSSRNSPVPTFQARPALKSRVKHVKMIASSEMAGEKSEDETLATCTLLDEIKEALRSGQDEEHQLPRGVVLDYQKSRAILPGGLVVYYIGNTEEADSDSQQA